MFRSMVAEEASYHGSIVARAAHFVSVSDDAACIFDSCADLARLSTLDAEGVRSIPFWLAQQLGLPLVGPDPGELAKGEWDVPLWSGFVKPEALAQAVSHTIRSQGFVRERAYSLAGLVSALRAARDVALAGQPEDAAVRKVYTITVADIAKVSVQTDAESPEEADARVAAGGDPTAGTTVTPVSMGSMLYAHIVDKDGSFRMLALLECALFPRFRVRERNGGTNGFKFLAKILCARAFAEFVPPGGDAPNLAWLQASEAAVEMAACMKERMPPILIADAPKSPVAARMLIARLLAEETPLSLVELSHVNVATALEASPFEVLRVLFGPAAASDGRLTLSCMQTAREAAERDARGPLTLGALLALGAVLAPMQARILATAEAQKVPPQQGLMLLLRRDKETTSAGGGGGGAPAPLPAPSNGETAASYGYASTYAAALKEEISSGGFIEDSAKIQYAFDTGVSTYEIIGMIFRTRRVIYIYALLGKKHGLDGIPLVQLIADELVPHGPRFLGWVGRNLLVPGMDDGRAPPALTAMWSKLCAFSLNFDLVNDFLLEVHAHYKETKIQALPKDKVYAELEMLRKLQPVVKEQGGLFWHIGFSSDVGGSFGDVYDTAIAYWDQSVGLDEAKIGRDVRAALTGVLAERTEQFSRAHKCMRPNTVWGGRLVITDSPAVAQLESDKKEAPDSLRLLRQLKALDAARVREAISGQDAQVGVVAPHKKPDPIGGVGGGGGGGDGVGVKLDVCTPIESAKKLGIGRYDKLAKTYDNGTKMYYGKKEAAVDYVDLVALEEAHPGLCPPKLFSTSESPWFCCWEPGKKGHTTRDQGAHQTPKKATQMGMKAWRALFIVSLAAAAPAGGDGVMLRAGGDSSLSPRTRYALLTGSIVPPLIALHRFGETGAVPQPPTAVGSGATKLATGCALVSGALKSVWKWWRGAAPDEASPTEDRPALALHPEDFSAHALLPAVPSHVPSLSQVLPLSGVEDALEAAEADVGEHARMAVAAVLVEAREAVSAADCERLRTALALARDGGPVPERLLNELAYAMGSRRISAASQRGIAAAVAVVGGAAGQSHGVVSSAMGASLPTFGRWLRKLRQLIVDCDELERATILVLAQVEDDGPAGLAESVADADAERQGLDERTAAQRHLDQLQEQREWLEDGRIMRERSAAQALAEAASSMADACEALWQVDRVVEGGGVLSAALLERLAVAMGAPRQGASGRAVMTMALHERRDGRVGAHNPLDPLDVFLKEWGDALQALTEECLRLAEPLEALRMKKIKKEADVEAARRRSPRLSRAACAAVRRGVSAGLVRVALPLEPPPSPPPSPTPAELVANEPSLTMPAVVVQPCGEATLMLVPTARMAIDGNAVNAIGFPEREPAGFFGLVRVRGKRDDDLALATRLAAAVLPAPHDTFYLFETSSDGAGLAVVHGEPRGLLQARALPVLDGAVWWHDVKQLEGEARWWADLVLQRIATHVSPQAAMPHYVCTGALAQQRVDPQQFVAHGRHHRLTWEAVANRTAALHESLRAELELAAQREDLDESIRRELTGWVGALSPPPLHEVPLALRAAAIDSTDERLAGMCFPAHAVPVATPPLPPLPAPPPVGVVPGWATGWEHALRPQPYHLLVALFKASRARMRGMAAAAAGDTGKLPSKPPLIALGPEAYQPWAKALIEAGEVLVKRGGKLALLDRSATPPTHFGREYIASNVLGKSRDLALRDAILTHGIEFTLDEKLPPYLVVQQNMDSLIGGFGTVHSELAKNTSRGWYEQLEDELDKGEIPLDCLPAWFNPAGAVPRKLSNVWRRILDAFAPRTEECVLNLSEFFKIPCPGGARAAAPAALVALIVSLLAMRSYRDTRFADKSRPVGSINEAAGMMKSRTANRAVARANDKLNVRVSAAQRKRTPQPRLDARGQAVPRPLAPGATFPPELKPMFADAMLSMALLSYVAVLLGGVVVAASDDFKSHFHQFVVSFGERWMFHLLALDPADVAAGLAGTQALAVFAEKVMGMGIGPASNWAQRFSTELIESYLDKFHEAESPYIKQLRLGSAAFDGYCRKREVLERTSGRRQLCVAHAVCYTDDPLIFVVHEMAAKPTGSSRVVRALVVWHEHIGPAGANVLTGDAVKRHFGAHVPWIGGEIITTANLSFLSADVRLRLQAMLVASADARLTVQDARKLNGTLEHVVGMSALRPSAMRHMYEAIDAARRLAGRDPEPALVLVPGEKQTRATLRWIKALDERTGASAFAAVFEVRAPPSVTFHCLRCDAAVLGTHYPGLSGGLYSFVWLHPLTMRQRMLPIAALEYCAQGFFNLCIFHDILPIDAEVVLVGDALVAALAVARGPKVSRLLHAMHEAFVTCDAYVARRERLSAAQEYGVGNPVFDHGSRGRVPEMERLMHKLGLVPRWLPVPEACVEYLDAAATFWLEGVWMGCTKEEPPSKDMRKRRSMHATALEHGPAANGAGPRTPFSEFRVGAPGVASRGRGGGRGGRGGVRGRARGPQAPPTPPTVARLPRVANAQLPPPVNMTLISRAREREMRETVWAASPSGLPPPSPPTSPPPAADEAQWTMGTPEPADVLLEARREREASAERGMQRQLWMGLNDASSIQLHAIAEATGFADVEGWDARLRAEEDEREAAREAYVSTVIRAHDESIASEELRAAAAAADEAELQRALAASMEGLCVEAIVVPPRQQPHQCCSVNTGEWKVCRLGGCGGFFCDNCGAPRPHPWLACLTGGACGVAPACGAEPVVPSIFDESLAFQSIFNEPLTSHLAGYDSADELEAFFDDNAPEVEMAAGSGADAYLHATAVEHGDAANGAGPRTPFAEGRVAAVRRASPPPAARPVLTRARNSPPSPPYATPLLMLASFASAAAMPNPSASRLPQHARAACPARRAAAGVGPVPVMAAPPVEERRAVASWEAALINDESPMALCPGNPAKLVELLDQVGDKMSHAFAAGTNAKDAYHLRAWKAVCAALCTPCWRTDVAANSGADPVGYKREILLLAVGLIMLFARMRPRSKKDPQANPRSALQKLRAVAREHKKRGYIMAPLTFAVEVMKGMLHEAVALHGTDWLAPARKRPLTNAIINAMLSVADGLAGMGLVVALSSYFWVAALATFAVLAETGMRKADVSRPLASTPRARGRLTFESLRWEIDGIKFAFLTVAQLLAARPGYACFLVYGVLKNDPYAEFYGSRPSKLEYAAGPLPNACRALVALELAAALPASQRGSTPLFGPKVGSEWHHAMLTKVFKFLLVHAAHVPAAEADGYSIHSFRIYLACALYAAGCPNDRIQAILRWKSEEALLIYARLNDSERNDWINRARAATVDSTVAAHLPVVDGAEMAARLLGVDAAAEDEEEDEEA